MHADRHASEVFLLADSTKFETKGDFKLSDLQPEFTIITDDKLSESVYNMYRDHKLNVVS